MPYNKDNDQSNKADDFINLVNSEPISDMRNVSEGFTLDTSINEKPSKN